MKHGLPVSYIDRVENFEKNTFTKLRLFYRCSIPGKLFFSHLPEDLIEDLHQTQLNPLIYYLENDQNFIVFMP